MCDRNQTQFNSISFWLLIGAFALAFTTRHALAADEGRPAAQEPAASANAAPPGLPDRITTLDGKTYEKAILERVDPDGLLVAFAPVGGGSGPPRGRAQHAGTGILLPRLVVAGRLQLDFAPSEPCVSLQSHAPTDGRCGFYEQSDFPDHWADAPVREVRGIGWFCLVNDCIPVIFCLWQVGAI